MFLTCVRCVANRFNPSAGVAYGGTTCAEFAANPTKRLPLLPPPTTTTTAVTTSAATAAAAAAGYNHHLHHHHHHHNTPPSTAVSRWTEFGKLNHAAAATASVADCSVASYFNGSLLWWRVIIIVVVVPGLCEVAADVVTACFVLH